MDESGDELLARDRPAPVGVKSFRERVDAFTDGDGNVDCEVALALLDESSVGANLEVRGLRHRT
ncbi:MAG: hypothetical protein M3321_10065 [Actinomycetota bacterium]|nr:hypothetical protein [Actinomycetota bacterium]